MIPQLIHPGHTKHSAERDASGREQNRPVIVSYPILVNVSDQVPILPMNRLSYAMKEYGVTCRLGPGLLLWDPTFSDNIVI